jgi:hypothetical protein
MNNFVKGFILGVLLKKHFVNGIQNVILEGCNIAHKLKLLHIKKDSQNVNKSFLLFFINNETLFRENFPYGKLQPGWEYNELNKYIKIDLDDAFMDYVDKNNLFIEVNQLLLEQVTLDIPFFETFSTPILYVQYSLDDKKYINCYNMDSVLGYLDFTTENEIINNIICVTLQKDQKNEYVTKHFSKFLNNGTSSGRILFKHVFGLLDLQYPITEYKVHIVKNNTILLYEMNDPFKEY